MLGNLKKHKKGYSLIVDNVEIAIYDIERTERPLYSLSKSNCEKIELGYDLDDLSKQAFPLDYNSQAEEQNYFERMAWKEGFRKALEIIDGRKFSKEDMQICRLQTELELLNKYYERIGLDADTEIEETLEQLKSIQKNEWEVEVETENSLTNGYKNQPENIIGFISEYKSVPKLDENGCLILKRK